LQVFFFAVGAKLTYITNEIEFAAS
jgi:hypothetical protein